MSPMKRCQSASGSSTILPRGPTMSTSSPGWALRAQILPGPSWAVVIQSANWSLFLVDGVHAVAATHQLAGRIGELHHDVVARDPAQECGLTCENDLVDRGTERGRGDELADASIGIQTRGELDRGVVGSSWHRFSIRGCGTEYERMFGRVDGCGTGSTQEKAGKEDGSQLRRRRTPASGSATPATSGSCCSS